MRRSQIPYDTHLQHSVVSLSAHTYSRRDLGNGYTMVTCAGWLPAEWLPARLGNGYIMVTMVIQWLYNGYTMVIQWLYNGYTMFIQCLYNGYTMVIQWLYNGYTMGNGYINDIYTMAAHPARHACTVRPQLAFVSSCALQ
jgi:hypothetical protein